MNLTMLALAILPIIAFVLVDMYAGLKNGVLTAMALGILTFALNIWITKTIDATTIIEPILIIICGLLTLRFSNPRFFKFQPVIVNISVIIILSYYQIFSVPFLVKYLPPMLVAMPQSADPEVIAKLQSPEFLHFLAKFSYHLIYFFIAHTILVWYTAIKSSNLIWLLSRLLVYPTFIIMIIVEMMPIF